MQRWPQSTRLEEGGTGCLKRVGLCRTVSGIQWSAAVVAHQRPVGGTIALLARTAHSLADLAGWRVGMLRLCMRAWTVLLLVDDRTYRRVGRVGLVGTVSAHGGAVQGAVDQQVTAGPSERRQRCANFYADMAEQISRPVVTTAHVDQ